MRTGIDLAGPTAARQRARLLPADDAAAATSTAARPGPARSTCTLYVLNPCREYWFDVVDRAASRTWPRAARPTITRRATGCSPPGASRRSPHIEPAGRRRGATASSTTPLRRQPTRGSAARRAAGRRARPDRARARRARARRPTTAASRCTSAIRSRASSRCCTTACSRCSPAPDPPQPGDILVVTPDLEAAAPLIDAVFGTAPRERATCPTRSAGRARSAQVNAPARALLDAAGARGVALPRQRRVRAAAAAGRRAPLRPRTSDELDQIRDWIVRRRHPLGPRRRASRRLRRARASRATASPTASTACSSATRCPSHARRAVRRPAAGRRRRRLGRARAGRVLALRRRARAAARTRSPRRSRRPTGRRSLADASRDVRRAGRRRARGPARGRRRDRASCTRTWRRQRRSTRRSRSTSCAPRSQALLDDPARGGVPTGAVTFSSMSSLRNLPYPRRLRDRPGRRRVPRHRAPAEFDLMALRAAPRRPPAPRRRAQRVPRPAAGRARARAT